MIDTGRVDITSTSEEIVTGMCGTKSVVVGTLLANSRCQVSLGLFMIYVSYFIHFRGGMGGSDSGSLTSQTKVAWGGSLTSQSKTVEFH